ncbi:hypothetical protein [Hwanghaeella sp.]|uniref:hypothetical protein n=1 Tax=Hwanghaeella sp. TaxID=2605943 RepID=UPI003CCBC758
MTQSIGRSKRGRPGAPKSDRVAPRVGPLLGAPPPIVFRTPKRPDPTDGAPELSYRVLASAPGDCQGMLELTTDRPIRIPSLSIICCVTGVSLADVAPRVLDGPLQIRFMIPDVPGNIRLETSDPEDTSIRISHPPARLRSFGVERTRGLNRAALPKLPSFAGFRRR